MSYFIKLKGNNEPLRLSDQDGEVVDQAYEKWNTTKVDTYLKLPSWRGNASNIASIQIEKTTELVNGVDSDMAREMREQSRYERAELRRSPEGRFEAYTRKYFCFLTYAFNGVYPKEENFPAIQEKYAFLVDWFRDNPKRLIPDAVVVYPDIDFKKVRESMAKTKDAKDLYARMTLFNAYQAAVGRDYEQLKWR